MLHGRSAKLGANLFQYLFALRPIIIKYPDFYEFVANQIDIDFVQYRWCQPGLCYHDHRVKRMRFGAKLTAKRGVEI